MHILKRAVIALALVMTAGSALPDTPPNPFPWVKANELYVTPSASRQYGPDEAGVPGNAIYVITRVPSTLYGPQQTDTWHTVDLKPLGVTADAQAAFLSGILIITHGNTPETADMTLTFRRPGDSTPCTKYLGQAVEAHIGGGQRSPISSWVPLADGKFEFCYRISTPGSWPTNSAYGINMSLQAWTR